MGRAKTGVGIERRVLAAVGEIGEVFGAGQDWRPLLCDHARNLTNARMGVVGEVRGWKKSGLARPVRVTDTGLDDHARSVFMSYLADASCKDPFLEKIVASPRVPRTYVRRGMVDDGAWYSTAYVDDYRKSARVDDMLLCVLAPHGDDSALTVATHRSWNDGQFSSSDVRAMELLQQALQGWSRVLLPPVMTEVKSLPPRLRSVLEGLIAGRNEKQVAADLGLSTHTVHMHVKRLHRSLGVSNRAELVREGLRRWPALTPQQ